MTYYMILGIPATADADDIRHAFRALVRQHHPDVGHGSSARAFREVVEAYRTLIDPERRRRYDASLQPATRIVRQQFRSRHVEPLIPIRPEEHVVLRQYRTLDDALFEELFRSIERIFFDW